MLKIFRFLMENGYYPKYEKNYIMFDVDDNSAVLEYEDGVLTVRIFFTIDEEAYELFLEASNSAMLQSHMVKPIIMEDMKSIMFSCENLCDSMNDFKRFFPRMVELTRKGLYAHKQEMKTLIQATEAAANKMPALDEGIIGTGKSRGKLLS